MNRRAYERLLSLRANCEKCNGKGYLETSLPDGSITLQDCECVIEVEREQLLSSAHIPQQHRVWGFSQMQPDFIKSNRRSLRTVYSFMKNLDKKIQSGSGLWFFSQPGLLKSSIICAILKSVLDRGYKAYYATATDLLDLKFAAVRRDAYAVKQLEYILENVHMLAIEEIDKVRLGDNDNTAQRHLFFDLLSTIYNENISLLISSNSIRDYVTKGFPSYITDRLKTVDSVPFMGKSGRTNRA